MRISRTLSNITEFWLLWLVVTGISWSICMVLAVIIGHGLQFYLPAFSSLLLGTIVSGALLGLSQLVLLHPHGKGVLKWTLASSIGWIIGLAFTGLVLYMTGKVASSFFGAALGGLAFGSAQWLAIDSEDHRKNAWVVVTLLAWSVAFMLGVALLGDNEEMVMANGIAFMLVSWTLGWCILALIGLVAMTTVLPRPEKKGSDIHIRWW